MRNPFSMFVQWISDAWDEAKRRNAPKPKLEHPAPPQTRMNTVILSDGPAKGKRMDFLGDPPMLIVYDRAKGLNHYYQRSDGDKWTYDYDRSMPPDHL